MKGFAETENLNIRESEQSEQKEVKKNIRQRLKVTLRKSFVSLAVPLLILFFIVTFFIQRIVITVQAGEAAVFWSLFFGGTQINYVHPEGIHFILPWDKMHVYNVRIQEIARKIDVLTKQGLPVSLLVSIRYAPDYRMLGVLHQRVGPDYVNTVIIPEIESVLRETIGVMDEEQIYTTGREVITRAIDEAIDQIAQRYINVDDVLIKKIELPPLVSDAIKFKIQQKHLVEAHEFIVQKEKKEAERKRIEGQGIRDHNDIVKSSLTDQQIIKWHGIQAIKELAASNNSKVFVLGMGKDGVPMILNSEEKASEDKPSEEKK
jgi:regulator of protease activity HflC (stomatin/prohibitin superfamily)